MKYRIFSLGALSVFTLLFGVGFFRMPALAASISPSNSSMGATKESLTADGIEDVQITVLVRDTFLATKSGVQVELFSSRGVVDEIKPSSVATTDSLGRARFTVRSLKNGLATFTAQADGIPMEKWVDRKSVV